MRVGPALLPAPQWLGEFEPLPPELACPVTVLSAAGVLSSGYGPGPNILPSELEELRQECIGPVRSRLLTVLLVSAIGIQSVAVLEYYRNRRRRSWEIELQDQQDLFASVED